jgi:hypothetical protein
MTLFSQSRLTRRKANIDSYASTVDAEAVNNILTLVNGGGMGLLRDRVIARFAQSIVKRTNQVSGSSEAYLTTSFDARNFVAQKEEAKVEAIREGLHTISSTFLCTRIIEERSTLFGAGADYTYSTEDATWTTDILEARTAAFHDRRMARLDQLSCGIGSAGLLVSADETGFRYQSFSPAHCWVVFGDDITMNGKQIEVDNLNLEHASVIVLELASTGTDRNFVAYHGRQDDYPNGRLVRYTAQQWNMIPDVGGGGKDFCSDGEWRETPDIGIIENPLTAYQSDSNSLVEYPFIVWHMDSTADGTSIFPTTGSLLYDQCMEIDVEYSRIIESAGRSAAGIQVLKNENGADILGPWNEGMAQLLKGQEVEVFSHAASNAKDALMVSLKVAEQTAQRWHVPGYMVAAQDNFQVPSGYALDVMNLPLDRDREARTEINRAAMSRKFNIESALANMVAGKETIALDATEHWEPRELSRPTPITDQIAQHKHELENNLASVIDLVQESGKAETREAAIEYIERTKEDNAKYKAQQQQPGRLAIGNRRQVP